MGGKSKKQVVRVAEKWPDYQFGRQETTLRAHANAFEERTKHLQQSIETIGGQPPRDIFNQVLASGIELATKAWDSIDSGAENAHLVDKINRIEARLNGHCEQYTRDTKDTKAFQKAYSQPPNSFTHGPNNLP